jgi:hypothetical protein
MQKADGLAPSLPRVRKLCLLPQVSRMEQEALPAEDGSIRSRTEEHRSCRLLRQQRVGALVPLDGPLPWPTLVPKVHYRPCLRTVLITLNPGEAESLKMCLLLPHRRMTTGGHILVSRTCSSG